MAALAKGRYLCFVNDDIAFGCASWLDDMMGHAIRIDVGAVGAKLVHPAGLIQHVGVICHKGVAGHLMKGVQNGNPGNGWLGALTHEAQAVTGACMLVRRSKFDLVGGFDDVAFPMNYSDTDFCMRLRDNGLRNVVEIGAELLHPEGATRSDGADFNALLRQIAKDNARFAAIWSDDDPYWHPSFALGLSQGGAQISGLNRDMLLWTDRKFSAGAARVLLVNDLPGLQGQSIARSNAGEIVFIANMSGFALTLKAPVPANVSGWDIRNPDLFALHARKLGIDRIVLRSLIGPEGAAAPVEALRFLKATGIPVDVDAIDLGMVAPWLSTSDSVSTPAFGFSSDMGAWRTAFEDLAPELAEAVE
jgi:hypothetical protein